MPKEKTNKELAKALDDQGYYVFQYYEGEKLMAVIVSVDPIPEENIVALNQTLEP